MPQRRRDDDQNAAALQAIANAAVNWFQRLPAMSQLLLLAAMAVVGIAVALWYFNQQRPTGVPTGVAQGSPHLFLGNPSNAGTGADNYLMVKPYYALSYNGSRGTPNWVSWRLIAADLGDTPRRDAFHPDADLPADFYHVTPRDYDRSGFDRGHMCPYGDRQLSQTTGDATFAMSNMIPQAPNVNRKAWEHMESYCRDLARHGHRLYVTAGPAGRGGVGHDGPRDALADGRVVVPSDCWKVVVILDDDPGIDPDPATLPTSTRVLTVDMPNDDSTVGEEWAKYRTDPADVERRAGVRFFDRLRPDVADALRHRVDTMPLPEPRPMRRE